MSLAKIESAAAKIPPQGLMKMGDSGACLASVAHNVDKNIPDDTHTCREHQENSGPSYFYRARMGCGVGWWSVNGLQKGLRVSSRLVRSNRLLKLVL